MPPAARTSKTQSKKSAHQAQLRKAKACEEQARQTRARRQFGLLCVCCLLLQGLLYLPPSFNGKGDTSLTLITAQTILRQGTIKLDAHESQFASRGYSPEAGSYSLHRNNGHLYNYFPLGSSLLSVPMVALYNIFGVEMSGFADTKAQSFSAALTCVWMFLMLYLFARRYLSPLVALLTALAFLLGSSLSSVLGSALWSHNFVAPLAMTILFLVIKAMDRPPSLPRRFGALIGVLLFLVYLCRPTAALLAPPVVCALFFIDKRSAFYAAAAAVLSGLLFIGASYYEYGQWLPEYYLPKRLGNPDYWAALYGHLLSPARGLLIYTPVLLLMAFTPGCLRKALAGRKVLLLLALWPVLHLLAVSSFPHWWGGWSYGPRLMVDILPALYVFVILYVQQLLNSPHSLARTLHVALLVVVAAASIPMHTWCGLYDVGGAY